MSAATPATTDLKHTPLHALHLSQQGKMVPFAGYSMPVQYALGVKGEHLHTRSKAGLFDVSHMGQLLIKGEQAAQWLETLVPVDIQGLPVGRQRYALFTNDNGGVMDDLMVSRLAPDCLYLVVNAACKEQDIAHLNAHLQEGIELEVLENRALIALQGPKAVDALLRLCPEVQGMVFMDTRPLSLLDTDCLVSRAGYTGEDGFEISIPAEAAVTITERLLEEPEVTLIGLGARDSLRLEAGLCLYGNDMTSTTTPVEANLTWAISKARRLAGERAGGFPGSEIIFKQTTGQSPAKRRVGLVGQSRAPVREGAELTDAEGNRVGQVTSGTFGPTVEMPVAMAYVNSDCSEEGTELFANVRGKSLPMTVKRMPFIQPKYYRG